MFRRIAGAFLVGAALVAACGDDDSSSSPPGPDGGLDSASAADAGADTGSFGPDTSFDDPILDAGAGADAAKSDVDATPPYVTQFCQDYLNASLSSLTTCCPNDQSAPELQFVEGFAQLTMISCTQFYTTRLANERVHYLPQNAPTCLDAVTYRAADCPDGGGYGNYGTPKASPVCEQVFGGVQSEGQDCAGDQECANLLPCQGSTCTRAATEAGAPCQFANSRDSDPGLFAQRPRCIAGETCNGERCVPPAKVGEGCLVDDDCAKGLYCNGGFAGTCQPLVVQDAGGPCDEDKFCNSGLSCQDGGCTARLAAGASCTETIVNGTQCAGYCNGATDAGPGTCHTFCGSF